jgi:hypothetical protein
VWLRHTDSGQEVFRTDLPAAGDVHTAFSADGRFLLTRWQAADAAACLDVWQV